jgi:hypothetical protein
VSIAVRIVLLLLLLLLGVVLQCLLQALRVASVHKLPFWSFSTGVLQPLGPLLLLVVIVLQVLLQMRACLILLLRAMLGRP